MPSLPTLQIISNTLKKEIGYFFKNEEKNGFIITDPNDRRIVISRSGPHGKTTYELELLAEGMKNPFMEPARDLPTRGSTWPEFESKDEEKGTP